MDAEKATEIATAYFKQCTLSLSWVKVIGVVPFENDYIVDCEHKCCLDPEQRHRLRINMDGRIIAVQVLETEAEYINKLMKLRYSQKS